MKSLALTACVVAFLAAISGCTDKNPTDDRRVYSFSGPTMGTSYTVKFVAAEGVSSANLQAEVQQVLDRVNAHMSTYQKESELSQFNRSPIDEWFAVSAETVEVVGLSLSISQLTNGAFDTTVGPLVNLWGFGPDPSKLVAPSDIKIDEALNRVGYQHVQVRKKPAGLKKSIDAYVDLSAVAKGYAVDEVASLVGARYPDYLIEVGGELRAQGKKQDGQSWKIAVESPIVGTREIQRIIAVDDIAIATSGDYRNYFEQNGVRYSHTIDPKTGKPVKHKLASVTVLDPSCAKADAMATAFMVLGEEQGMALAKKLKMPVFMIYKTDEGFAEEYTDEFSAFLQD